MVADYTLIRNSIDKSKQALISAKLNIDYNLLSDAQNRIYYAIYYSVLALAFLEGYNKYEHRDLILWFTKKYIIEENIFDRDSYIAYKIAYKECRKYDNIIIEYPLKADVVKNFSNAKLFIIKLEKYITDNLQQN
jgi:uncharacterized protein (UPF0332 family)